MPVGEGVEVCVIVAVFDAVFDGVGACDGLSVKPKESCSVPAIENADASVALKASADIKEPVGSTMVCPGALAKAKRGAPSPKPLTSAQLRGPGRYVRKTSEAPAGVQGQKAAGRAYTGKRAPAGVELEPTRLKLPARPASTPPPTDTETCAGGMQPPAPLLL